MPKDDIQKEYFLLPMINFGNELNNMKNEKIVIINYKKGILNYSNGIIQNINKYELTHSVNDKMDSSGNPILLKDNNKVIAIHHLAYFQLFQKFKRR